LRSAYGLTRLLLVECSLRSLYGVGLSADRSFILFFARQERRARRVGRALIAVIAGAENGKPEAKRVAFLDPA